uniref:Uncharacterized protein n=1 Tax=Anguilla anguilla TaxID=7936 RepID=A0A0E9SXG1_ANGAN
MARYIKTIRAARTKARLNGNYHVTTGQTEYEVRQWQWNLPFLA